MSVILSVALSYMFLVFGQPPVRDSLLVQGGIKYFRKYSSTQLIDKKRIYTYNPITEQKNLLYKGKAIVKQVSVSPDGRLIGFLEKGSLVILNFKSEVIHKVSGNNKGEIKKYKWNPEGNKIVFISYEKKDPDYPYRYPNGLWIFNLNTGEKAKIADRADEIYWASHDSNIYFIDYREGREKVYKWDSETGKIGLTPYKDIRFSPDGDYYLYKPPIETGITDVQIYNSESNKNISKILPENIGSLSGWVYNESHLLLFRKTNKIIKTEGKGSVKAIKSKKVIDSQNFIFDVEKGKIVKEFPGKPTFWLGGKDKIIVERNGKIVFEGLPK